MWHDLGSCRRRQQQQESDIPEGNNRSGCSGIERRDGVEGNGTKKEVGARRSKRHTAIQRGGRGRKHRNPRGRLEVGCSSMGAIPCADDRAVGESELFSYRARTINTQDIRAAAKGGLVSVGVGEKVALDEFIYVILFSTNRHTHHCHQNRNAAACCPVLGAPTRDHFTITLLWSLPAMPASASSSNPLRRYLHGSGNDASWAIVTGSTNGMGEEFAHQLAGLGFNVILHGRNAAKLASVQAAITSKHTSTQVRTVAIDAGANLPDLTPLLKLLAEVRVTVLVNNVGVVSQDYPLLEDERPVDIAMQITTNTVFPTILASQALPSLKKNTPSLMINMASLGAWAPTPL